ncbi:MULTISPECIES: glutaredoxin domain-containing protein [Mycolicibacterium]|jgi:glutaredoxin-like protein|uniref:Glutaredoxin-like protein n=1 Tax=Mycolicibacterium vanbaalenii (strain DSM 7251 / JCM 13017 / BCRC 16820 / KCTC 9966 / NRRL B-24157 / PYR-1) TaxID=350058 RepID=A1TE87_MYCVP|nr:MULTISPECIES: glutaredoxin domain-containing protein [Mycolicibacterium]ABM15487.1 Glutaredoxin-like protein [Mycolicibacterium vanbaalenii PYR-1]MCV7130779.1 NrdH-redoxin [Mycolicibacterium vanbaalenii PYR-1]MDW5612876.1 glutaredoxin domain-containing protein [Mycolicibacterium sp. D5.8-2]
MADSQASTSPQSSDRQAIEVYWRPGCPFCRRLMRALRGSGLTLREVNIWEDAEAAARVRSVADGNETVPTVFIGDRALVNPSSRQVFAAIGHQPPPRLWDRLRGR